MTQNISKVKGNKVGRHKPANSFSIKGYNEKLLSGGMGFNDYVKGNGKTRESHE